MENFIFFKKKNLITRKKRKEKTNKTIHVMGQTKNGRENLIKLFFIQFSNWKLKYGQFNRN